MDFVNKEIARHKTAIRRNDFSLPVKCLLRDSLLGLANGLFDYGCGHGENITLLKAQGIKCDGWDPVFCPTEPLIRAAVVNLGYVINVIEDAEERSATLKQAWHLADRLLTVSAQIQVNGRGNSQVTFGDGIVTRLGTFQKFYTQTELREYLETQLGVDAIPAALGVFYIFKDESLQQQFLASKYRRRAAAPRKRISELRFEENREILETLIAIIAELGRLPAADEFAGAPLICEKFGSLKKAFSLIKKVTGIEGWDEIRRKRTEDLLVYLALARFRKRPIISKYPITIQRDIREFFGTYQLACNVSRR